MLGIKIKFLTISCAILSTMSTVEAAKWKNDERPTVKISCGSFRSSLELKVNFYEDEKLVGEPYAVLSNLKFIPRGQNCSSESSCGINFDSELYQLQVTGSDSPYVLVLPFDKQLSERTYMTMHMDKKLFFNIENKECIFLSEKESAKFIRNRKFPYKPVDDLEIAPSGLKDEPLSSAYFFWVEKSAKEVYDQFMRDYPDAQNIVSALRKELKPGSFQSFKKKIDEIVSKDLPRDNLEELLKGVSEQAGSDDYVKVDQIKAFNGAEFQKGFLGCLTGKYVSDHVKELDKEVITFCGPNTGPPVCCRFHAIKKKENGKEKVQVKFVLIGWTEV
jgi:hypothetical protein